MGDLKNFKIGEAEVDSIMFDGPSIWYKDNIFTDFKFANDAGGYYVKGLYIAPYGNWGVYSWPWDLGVAGGALKDINYGWRYWGYVQDGTNKSLSNSINTTFPTNGIGDTNWRIAITVWFNDPNYTDEAGKTYLDLGEHPITITFLDDRFDDFTWTTSTGAVYEWSDDNRTIVIHRIPFSTHVVCVGHNGDTTIDTCRAQMTDIRADVTGLTYNYSVIDKYTLGNEECWDAYYQDGVQYHKDKTFDNLYKKYHLALPYISDNRGLFASWYNSTTPNEHIEWIAPLRFLIKDIAVGTDTISIYTGSIACSGTYQSWSFKQYTIKCYDKPDDMEIKFYSPLFTNAITEDATQEIVIENGENDIPAYSKVIYNGTSNKIYYNRFDITYTGDVDQVEPVIIDIEPVIDDTTRLMLRTTPFINYSNVEVPPVIDIEDWAGKLKFYNFFPDNPSFWDPIKEWYENNIFDIGNYESNNIFNGTSGLTEITINMPNDAYLFGEDNFANSDITKIRFVQSAKGSHFSAPQKMLRNCYYLSDIEMVFAEPDNLDNYICGANTVVEMFGNIWRLKTYPERFIKWDQMRSNVHNYSILCTLTHYAFNYCSALEEIPSYPYRLSIEENTIRCSSLYFMFRWCSSLRTVGPILDVRLCRPLDAYEAFWQCFKLEHILIKNLNHGDWHLDGTAMSNGLICGDLSSLDEESVVFLFNNLADLNTYDPNVHSNTADKSFLTWNSNYKDEISLNHEYDYGLTSAISYGCRKRYANISSAPFICYTTAKLTNCTFQVKYLQSGDQIIFCNSSGTEQTVFSTSYKPISVTTDGTSTYGFKFISTNTENRNAIEIEFINGWDESNPIVDHASLYCPSAWADKITSDMISIANARNWTIYVDGELMEVTDDPESVIDEDDDQIIDSDDNSITV